MANHQSSEPSLDELYRQVMSGFSHEEIPGFDVPGTPTPPPAPPLERKGTDDSDKLMSIYNSYVGPATLESDGPLQRVSPIPFTSLNVPPPASPTRSIRPLPTPQALQPGHRPSSPTAQSPTGRGANRPLPLPPAEKGSYISTPSSFMPQATPFQHPPPPPPLPRQRTSSGQIPESLRPNDGYMSPSTGPRRLPSTPGGTPANGAPDSLSQKNGRPSPTEWPSTSSSGSRPSYDTSSSNASFDSNHQTTASTLGSPNSGQSGSQIVAGRAIGRVQSNRSSPQRAGGPGLGQSTMSSVYDPSTAAINSNGYPIEKLYPPGDAPPYVPNPAPQKPVSTPLDNSSNSQFSENEPSTVRGSYQSGRELPPRTANEVIEEKMAGLPVHRPLELHEDGEFDFADDFTDPEEIEEDYFNSALLSHIAVKLRDKVPRGTHVKGSIPYQRAFTGKDIVSTIQSVIQRDLLDIAGDGRQTALQVARSLQNQLFFYEVEWDGRILSDGVGDVFMFLDEAEGGAGDIGGANRIDREELPTGVITSLTKCYSPSCGELGVTCYLNTCPRKTQFPNRASSIMLPVQENAPERGWEEGIDPDVLRSIPASEIKRQTIIASVIAKEAQYVKDLDLIDSLFIKPLRLAPEPIIPLDQLDDFIDTVFGNILDLRETNRRLLEVMYVRQREQGPVIQWIGDIFLAAAAEFRVVYPLYVGNLPTAEKRVKDEIENNHQFRTFVEKSRTIESRRLELKHFISRPSQHLQQYPLLLEAIRAETAGENPDAEYLLEASQAIRNLSTVAQLRTFQSSMGRGTPGQQEWHHLVAADVREGIPKKEQKRQAVIFELIKGEMEYVKDLELINTLFIRPLRASDIKFPDTSERGLDDFLRDIFYNYEEILLHHRRLLDVLHEVQREQHPCIHSIVAPIYDAALNWGEAYKEYVPHYPIAFYRVEEAMAIPQFKTIVEAAQRHSDARRLDIKFFINRPIPRMLRYDLLLKAILKETPEEHEDTQTIPEVLDVIKDLGKTVDHSIKTAERKVELWRYNRNLVWRPGEEIDMDLLDETRTLVHTGRLFRQPDGSLEWNGWSELFVLLFDNYLVMTKPKEKDGVIKYHVNRRPIPLELLTLLSFQDPPQQRGTSLLRAMRGGEKERHVEPLGEKAETTDSRMLYPCSVHHAGRVGGHHQLFAESAQVRAEWKRRLDEAMGLRRAVQEANKVFEVTTISTDTFSVPALQTTSTGQWNEGGLTGRVTCSVPLTSGDGRGLVAIGCAEGVWIGLNHDSRSMRRVLHLKQVTQCAMLGEFGIFLVLADKSLFAYHIEALVPSNPPTANSTRHPQKLNGSRDVQFFSVGTLNGRTLIIYMKKKGLDSVFRVLEPVAGKAAEKAKAPAFGRNLFGSKQSEWFRVYREFFLPSESFDLIFLKAKIAILCTKGFEIMDLADFKSITIPQRDDTKHAALAKRCESCKPMGMFRSSENEFLLCYDEFGLYVDRHGDPNRAVGVVEWEGTAERVAFHPPYILIFDTRFVEVRHIDKGKLVQIISGTDVHCTWDGRGSSVSAPINTPGPGGWDERVTADEPRVHAVMKAVEPAASPRSAHQHVFELTPTVPLYPPPSLQSPGTSYFPRRSSNSPPHSPRTSSGGSGWTR